MKAFTKAAMRGWFSMATIAVVFGFWQSSVLAGIFMLLLLLFIEKLFRVLLESGMPSEEKLTLPDEQSRIGIALDEPIEVSPGKFLTAREFTKNAVSPEEFDERLRAEASANPELAKVLPQHYGWKNGSPDGAVPVIKQIVDGG